MQVPGGKIRVSLALNVSRDGQYRLRSRLRLGEFQWGPVASHDFHVFSEWPRTRVTAARLLPGGQARVSVGTEPYLQPPGHSMGQVAAVHYSLDAEVSQRLCGAHDYPNPQALAS